MGDVATLPPKINDGVLRRWNARGKADKEALADYGVNVKEE